MKNLRQIEISNMIRLPKEELKNVNYRAYIYQNIRTEELVKNFWIDDKYAYFPRNIEKFKKNYKNSDNIEFVYNFVDKKTDNVIKLNPDFKLRPAQQKVINKLFDNYKVGKYDNIIQANVSFGKSYIVSYIISKLQRKTLILVDMRLLQDQMFNEIKQNTNADIQIVTSKTDKVADVNIATVQLLHKNPKLVKLFKNECSLIILDECHITAAETIKTVVQAFPAKYRIGLSATPTREGDGLTEILYDVFSNKIVGKGIVQEVEVHLLEETRYLLNPSNYKTNLNKAIENVFLQDLDILVEKLVGCKNKSIMIAVDSVDIQNKLAERYKKYGTAILNSSTKKADRDKILQDYEDEKIKILIGYKVLGKGISIPRMEVLINLFAATTKENLEQLLGRLSRTHPKKEKAFFIDFAWGLNMYRQLGIKKRVYRKLYNEGMVKLKIFDKYTYIGKVKEISC